MTTWKQTAASMALLATMTMAGSAADAQMRGGGMPGKGMFGMGYGMMSTGCRGFGPGMMGREGGMMGGAPGMMHGGGYDSEKAVTLLDERLGELKKELGIGDKQKDVWKAYAEAVKDRFTTMSGMHQTMHTAMMEGDAIERMELRVGMMENMLESMKTLLPAVKALYNALPDNKKSAANALLGGCGMM